MNTPIAEQQTAYTKETLTPQEINTRYGFSVSTLAKWRMKNKNLPFIKIGKYIKYRVKDIENFLNSHTEPIAEVA